MNQEISALRIRIDNLDKKLLQLLKKRFELTKEVGKIKKIKNLTIEDKKRENEIIENKIKNSNLNSKFIKEFFKLIFKESKKLQNA